MTTTETQTAAKRAAEVHAEMTALKKAILEGARLMPEGGDDPAIVNLGHYLALRHHDIRPLQRRLMALGLSSMGRLESRVLPTIDAVLFALSKIASDAVPAEAAILTALYEKQLARYKSRPADATALLGVGLRPANKELNPIDLAATTAVTRALLNLHETITRY